MDRLLSVDNSYEWNITRQIEFQTHFFQILKSNKCYYCLYSAQVLLRYIKGYNDLEKLVRPKNHLMIVPLGLAD